MIFPPNACGMAGPTGGQEFDDFENWFTLRGV
jgi:hypothetical protein